MATIVSLSIPSKNMKDLEELEKISHHRKENRSFTIVQAIKLFNKYNPIATNGQITDYIDTNFIEPILRIGKHTEIKQMRKMAGNMASNDLVSLKDQVKKYLTAIEIEIESRGGGHIFKKNNCDSISSIMDTSTEKSQPVMDEIMQMEGPKTKEESIPKPGLDEFF